MNCRVIELAQVVLLLAIIQACSGRSVYYITPSPNTSCPKEPCLTFSEYYHNVSDYFNHNTSLVFSPGNHILDHNITLENMGNLTLHGNYNAASRIICVYPVYVRFRNISSVEVNSLAFLSCGIYGRYAVAVISIQHFALVNSSLENSNTVGLRILLSNTTIVSSTFLSNKGGIAADNSTITFRESNYFVDNQSERIALHGGGIFFTFSNATVDGRVAFINNSATELGGAAFLYYSSLNIAGSAFLTFSNATVDGRVVFINNTAAELGGAAFLYYSSLNIDGSAYFIENQAEIGGAIYLHYSTVISNGETRFIGNIGINSTGAVYLNHSTFISNGETRFIGNIAVNCSAIICARDGYISFQNKTAFISNWQISSFKGGGIDIENSTLEFNGSNVFNQNRGFLGAAIRARESEVKINGSSIFANNVASSGGVIHAINSRVMIYGYNSFIGNGALGPDVHLGGAIYTLNCTVICAGRILFYLNKASLSGGAIHATSSNLTLIGSTFINNSALGGGAIDAYLSKVILFGNNNFTKNQATLYGSGGLLVSAGSLVVTGHAVFVNNTGRQGGGVYISYSSVQFSGEHSFTGNTANSQGGGFYAVSCTINFNGRRCLFYENLAVTQGGALYLVNSSATLGTNHTLKIENNSAEEGGGISLYTATIYFLQGSLLYLRSNTADRGAAIHVLDFINYADCFNSTTPELTALITTQCFYQIEEIPNFEHITYLIFESNEAKQSGSTLYGGLLDRCRLIAGGTILPRKNALDIFQNISKFNFQNLDEHISSDPFDICFCENGIPNCNLTLPAQQVIRGQTFTLSVVAVDQTHTPVPADIRTTVPNRRGQSIFLGESLLIQESTKNCSNLNFTVSSPNSSVQVAIFADGPCRDVGASQYFLEVNFLPCPVGFELSFSDCICEQKLQMFTNTCNVQDGRIERDGNFWISAVMDINDSSSQLLIHPNCPFDYCQSDTVYVSPNDPDEQCVFGHSGTLCGSCAANLSLALGSNRCLPCSNGYLALVGAFALAGIVLVIFLQLLKLTVVIGTVNGLIFYANVIGVNRSIFFPPGSGRLLSVFIAWLNLDLGIETCFFDGMDAYAKAWLQFAFPLYVWALVIVIIRVSHSSEFIARMLGSNPVAVLSTLFLLSYAKLLRTIIAVFAFTYLEYPGNTRSLVWLVDGNVGYLSGKHIPLFIAAALTLLFLFLPYTLLLLFAHLLQARSRKRVLGIRIFSWIDSYRIHPFLDAYHAPYVPKHRYWTGFLLLLRSVLFLVFAFNTLGDDSLNLLVISSATLGLAILSRFIGQVYIKWYIDVLEASFILNLGILAVGTYHIKQVGGNQAVLVHISAGVAFLMFICIAIYHVFLQVGAKQCVYCKRDDREREVRMEPIQYVAEQTTPTVSVIDFTAIREPLALMD